MPVLTFTIQLLPYTSVYKRGYTLVELLITITITTILIGIGVSAYGRASETQSIKSDTEKIISVITSAQKAATTGKADCTDSFGIYLGENFQTTVGSKTMIITSICKTGQGNPRNYDLTTFTFKTANSISFRPLNQGIDTGPTNSQNLDFGTSSDTYRIQLERSGSVKSLGKVSP